MREELRGGPGFRKRYRARRLPCCDPRQDGKGPPAHPPELAYPCCLPALGDLARLAPCEGSAAQFSPAGPRLWPLPAPAAPVSCPAEDSPSGLGRTLGKRVGGNPSGVRISYPPPPLTRQYTRPVVPSAWARKAAQSHLQSHSFLTHININRPKVKAHASG